ncbi:MAG: hypothetical protein WC058_14875 [Phycisphaeraceae bacterium]
MAGLPNDSGEGQGQGKTNIGLIRRHAALVRNLLSDKITFLHPADFPGAMRHPPTDCRKQSTGAIHGDD